MTLIRKCETINGDTNDENQNKNGDSNVLSGWEDDIFYQIKFTMSPKLTGQQFSRGITEPFDIFKLYFTDEIADNMTEETDNFANIK